MSKITPNGQVYTTQKALEEEKQLILNTRKGKGAFTPIAENYQCKNDLLTAEQKKAVQHALKSKDFVSIITGGAGTGKTWSIKEVAQGVKEQGLAFLAFAPSASASRGVQRADGFSNATTIAELLQSKKLQEQSKNGVIWIDEAGMVGNSTMNQIMEVAKTQNARILLTGDARQHGAVERGDALRIMQKYGGLEPAYISKIQRQKGSDYKQAVKQISDGNIAKGYQALDAMGAIKENEDIGLQLKDLSKEYVRAIQSRESVLVVATTHKQGKLVTYALRNELKEQGLLEQKGKEFTTQRNLSYTQAQKQDANLYEKGMCVQFIQHERGFKRGGKYEITGKDDKGNILVTAIGKDAVEKKKDLILPLNKAKKFSVYETEKLELAKGDQIRITQNGFSLGRSAKEKKRLNNGKLLEVKGFDEKGNILASTGKMELVLDKSYGNFTHGYYTTSPASQGKSVNRVLIVQNAASGRASNQEQFYVSASRGKFAISIYTDDKSNLLGNIQRSSARLTALEIAPSKAPQKAPTKNKLQTINQIAKVGLSTVSSAWKKTKSMLDFSSKPVAKTPVKYAPVKGK
ncbi:MAG: AAA family ATPase [Bacteroidota bacterium]